MDDDKWALVAWEPQRVAGKLYVLLQDDFYWDCVDYFKPDGSSSRQAWRRTDGSTLSFGFRSMDAKVR